MSSTTASGDPLRRVTGAEAAALSSGLLRYAKSHPALTEHPLFVILTRLVASIPDDDGIADLEGRLASALAEIDILQTNATTKMAQEEAEAARQKAELAEKARDEVFDAVLDLEQQVEQALGDREEALAERDDALAKLAKVMEEAKLSLTDKEDLISTLQLRADDAELRLAEVIAKKDKATEYLEDLRGRVREAQNLIKSKQWGARHNFHRDRRGKARCCPSCGGLSTEYHHRDAGHSKGCIFPLIEAALSSK